MSLSTRYQLLFFIASIFFTNLVLAWTPMVPVERWKVSYSFTGWGYGGLSMPVEDEQAAIEAMMAHVSSQNGCQVIFKGLDPKPAEETPPNSSGKIGHPGPWPTIQQKDYLNLCHGWSSTTSWYPSVWPGTDQEKGNKTCAMVQFVRTTGCRPDQGYYDYALEFFRSYNPVCPTGYAYAGSGLCSCAAINGSYAHCPSEADAGPLCTPDNKALDDESNPINVGTRSKYFIETDYVGGGPFPLVVRRYYDSQTTSRLGNFGNVWRSNYDLKRIPVYGMSTHSNYFPRPNGRLSMTTRQSDGTHKIRLPIRNSFLDTLNEVKDANGVHLGFNYKDLNRQHVENYDAAGSLFSIRNSQGKEHKFTYGANGRLETVTDSFQRKLTFRYDDSGRVIEIITPASIFDSVTNSYTRTLKYQYDVNGNITKFINAHGGVRTYLYELPQFPNALTGIINELGKRVRTWNYDVQGFATDSILGTNSSQYGRRSSFSSVGNTTTVNVYNQSNVLQRTGTYTTDNLADMRVLRTSSGQPCVNCSMSVGTSVSWKRLSTSVDTNVPDVRTLPGGRQDKYGYSSTSTLPTSYTKAHNESALSQSRTAVWDETTRRPTSSETQFVKTTYTYDDEGAILTKTELDKVTNATRTWTNTYEVASNGIKRLKYKYDPKGYRTEYRYSTTTGDLQYVINPLGQTNTVVINSAGDISSIRDPNGVSTYFTYASHGKLASIYTYSSSRILSFSYDSALRLTRITMPDKSYLQFSYNDVGWVTRVTNVYGDYAAIAYDENGFRKSISIYNSSGTLFNQESELYNSFGQLEQVIGGTNSARILGLSYDLENNIKEIRDAFNVVTYNDFDKLNRLTGNRLPNGGRFAIQYDKGNRITAMTDSNYLTTKYTYDGFGNLTQIESPDAGFRIMTYDLNGNMVTYTDNAGLVTSFEYDKINRLTKIISPDPQLVTTNIYDEGTLGRGRLTTVRDVNGYRALFYNSFGDITHVAQTIAGVEVRTIYTYDSYGRLSRIQYPSTRVVDYVYSSLGSRILSVNTTYNGVTIPLATNISYLPFDIRSGWTFGNNKILSRTFDKDYNLIRQTTTGIEDLNLTYDDNQNLLQTSDLLNNSQNQSFTYNSMHELSSFSSSSGLQNFSLDENGNRLPSAGPLSSSAAKYDTATVTTNVYSSYNPETYFEFTNSSIRKLGTASWASVGTPKTVSAGKYYWEVKILTLINTPATASKGIMIGVGQASTVTNSYLGVNKNGFAVSGGGGLYYNAARGAWGSPWNVGDVIGVAFDVDGKKIQYYKNGVLDGSSTVIVDVGVNVGGVNVAYSNMPAWKYTPVVSLYYPNDQVDVNFGNRAFSYAPPAGYTPFDSSMYSFTNWPLVTSTVSYDPKTKYSVNELSATKLNTSAGLLRVSKPINSGKWYWEAEYVRAPANSYYRAKFGIIDEAGNLSASCTSSFWAYCYYGDGSIYNRSTVTSGWPQIGAASGVIIGVLFDADEGKIYYYRNGVPMKNSTGLAYDKIPRGRTYYPFIELSYTSDIVKLNLGQQPFRYAPLDFRFKPLDPGGNGVKPLSNQLMAETYSPNGNPITYRGNQLIYNKLDRLSEVRTGSTTVAQYWYNSEGQRTTKRLGSYVTGFVYDLSGNMIAEIDGTGRTLKEYAYIDNERLAMMVPPVSTNLINNTSLPLPDATRASTLSALLTSASFINAISIFMSGAAQTPDPAGVYFYHNNQLGTPHTLTDTAGNIVWKSQNSPFGQSTISVQTVKNNHRLPGQYFDAETGLHQNWMRDYDPLTGRFLQVDPIGLYSDMNPYIYAAANPVMKTDIYGMASMGGSYIDRVKSAIKYAYANPDSGEENDDAVSCWIKKFEQESEQDPTENGWTRAYRKRFLSADSNRARHDLNLRNAEHYLYAYHAACKPAGITDYMMPIATAGYTPLKPLHIVATGKHTSKPTWKEIVWGVRGVIDGLKCKPRDNCKACE